MKNVFLEFFSNYLPQLLLSIQILQFTFHFNSITFFYIFIIYTISIKTEFQNKIYGGKFS